MKATIQLQLDQFIQEQAEIKQRWNTLKAEADAELLKANQALIELEKEHTKIEGKIELLTDMKDGN